MARTARPARRRSIRALLTPIFVVPLVSLLALWGFAASVTVLNALREHNFTAENKRYGGQAQKLAFELAMERSMVYTWLTTGRRPSLGPLLKQRRATDAAIAAFQSRVQSTPYGIVASARPALVKFSADLRGINTLRASVDAGQLTALEAFQAYNAIVNAQFRFYKQLIAVNNSSLYQQADGSLLAGRAVEMVDREVALVDGALADHGRMSRGERLLFAETVANQRLLMGDALKELQPGLAAGYRSVYRSPAHAAFASIESQITGSIGKGGPIPVTSAQWSTASFSFLAGFDRAELQDRMSLASTGTRLGNRLLLQVLLAAGLGLIGVAASFILMVRFGRRISRELTALQGSALTLATERLPRVVEQLGHGQEIDESARSASLLPGRIAEIAKVAEAFASVQHTAVEAAVGQARLRRGVSQVFRNLAWRSQALLHRQLALLDRMERKSTDPATLEELFQLDHLTTRMRRHAEGLIILSGETPGRGWRQPVPVVDVLRGAIAEVEDYTRVSVITRSADAVAGTAVADVIHLLAELIENATTNSPSNTEVTVRAERVANGIALEVEDRGLGMTDEDVAAANELFAKPPEFDLADSDKLGFFVIARLAARHQIKITLRQSPYGGLAAVVLLPSMITVTGESAGPALGRGRPESLQLPAPDWRPDAEPVGQAGIAGVADADELDLPRRARDPDLPERLSGAAAPPGRAPTVRSPVGQAPSMQASAGEAPEHSVAFGSTPDELGALASSLYGGWPDGRAESAVEPDDS